MPKPCLYYSAMAGRGELTRLIAAVGGLEIEEKAWLPDRAPFVSPGTWPCLEHGELRISQNTAIECYIASIAPYYKDLTPEQQAVDNLFCCIKDDMYKEYMNAYMAMSADESRKLTFSADLAATADRWFLVIEDRLPSGGFINGLDFPTVSDLAVLNIAMAFMPFVAFQDLAGYDVSAKWPHLMRHADRVAIYPSVKAYLDKSTTIHANPYGLPQVRPESDLV